MKHRLLALALVGLVGQVMAQTATYPVISELRFYETSSVNDEFIELYNPTLDAVDLSGWKIQYKSATGTSWTDKLTFPSGASIAAHGFVLFAGNALTTPTPDYIFNGAIGLGNSGGHVRLIDASVNQIDLVGWLTANAPEGAAINPTHPRTGSYERKSNPSDTTIDMAAGGASALLGNGWDSNNNLNDFVIHAPETANPQNSSSPTEPFLGGNVPPAIGAIAYTPNPLTPGADVTFNATITDSDGLVTVATLYYGTTPGNLDGTMLLSPAGGDQFTNLTPITAPGACQTLYYRVEAYDDAGDSALSAVFAAPVQCTLSIYEIQGQTDVSPYNGQLVTTEGQVTYLQTSTSMFIQEASGAWHGIQVFGAHPGVSEGDYIRVTGTVLEYNGFTEITNPGLVIEVLESPGSLVIEPVLVTVTDANLEDFESVLVRVENTTCVSANPFYVFDGNDQIMIYFPGYEAVEDECYNIQGVRYAYQFTKEILPRTIDEIQVCGTVGADELPHSFALGQAWPNPFNPSAFISYSLDRSAQVRLSVFNILGQEVAVLADQLLPSGQHQARFDATGLPSGLYLYTLQSEGRQLTGRMLLVR
ncbi:MAG: lamin tail domain-containing protein [bacterium]|nr:lamin tail domain-containing protein [bacterium]